MGGFMSFDNFSDFFAMGGHGFFVWLSYAVVLAVIIANVVLPLAQRRQILREQSQRLRR
jgi:heme exporter protein D